MKLSIVILNYKTPDITIQCIESILGKMDIFNFKYEILLADNNSQDGSLQKIMNRFSKEEKVKIYGNRENLGFSRGNNNLAKIAKGEYILFLNSDTIILEKEAITELLSLMEADQTIGIASCKLLNEDGSTQLSYAKLPKIKDVFFEYFFGKLSNHYKKVFKDTTEVETVIGAFMLIRKELFFNIGMFDDIYYFNVEDIDLCIKVIKSGHKILYVPNYSIIHLGGKSQEGINWVNNKNLHFNRIKYYEKHYNKFFSSLAKLIINTGILLRKTLRRNGE